MLDDVSYMLHMSIEGRLLDHDEKMNKDKGSELQGSCTVQLSS